MASTPPVNDKKMQAQKSFENTKKELRDTEESYGKKLQTLKDFFDKHKQQLNLTVKDFATYVEAVQGAWEANKKLKEMLDDANNRNLTPAEFIKLTSHFVATNAVPHLLNGQLVMKNLGKMNADERSNLNRELSAHTGTMSPIDDYIITIAQRGPRYDLLYKELLKYWEVMAEPNAEVKKEVTAGVIAIQEANLRNNTKLGDFADNAKILNKNFYGKSDPKIYLDAVPRNFDWGKIKAEQLKAALGDQFTVVKNRGNFIVKDNFGQSVLQINVKTPFPLFLGSKVTIKPLIDPMIDPKSAYNTINTQGVLEAMVKSAGFLEEQINGMKKNTEKRSTIDLQSKKFAQAIINEVGDNNLMDKLSGKTKKQYENALSIKTNELLEKELKKSIKESLEAQRIKHNKHGSAEGQNVAKKSNEAEVGVEAHLTEPLLLSKRMQNQHENAHENTQKQDEQLKPEVEVEKHKPK